MCGVIVAAVLAEVSNGLLEDWSEPLHVETNILLVEVGFLERIPAFGLDAIGVGEDGVVSRVLIDQRALLRRDPVLQVPEPHVPGRPAEVAGDELQPAQRHHLDHHAAGGEEHHVRQPRAVHAHHGVARVGELRERRHLVLALRHHHLEPGALHASHDLVGVHEPPRAGARDHQETRPPWPPRLLLAGRRERRVAGQAVGGAHEAGEVHHGVAVGRARRVDAEVGVACQADLDVAEAVDAAVVVEVDEVVVGDGLEHRQELAEPPHLEVGHQQLHLAGVLPRRQEQRQDDVGVRVEVVAGVPAVGEHKPGDVVPLRARRRRRTRRRGGQRLHRQHADVAHGVRVGLARVRLDVPRLGAERALVGGPRRRHQGDGAVGAGDADVAVELAPVDAAVRPEIAQRLPLLPPRRRL